MAQVTAPRRIALDVLRRVRYGELADHALDREAHALDSRDRAWTQELVYGVLRLRGRIDYLLAQLVRSGLGSLDADVLDVLRLGAYQLLEMGSVPPYAAVSQSVELARAAGAARAAGLVNGVLHSLQRRGGAIPFPDPEQAPVASLAARNSHPEWLIQRWVDRWGPEQTGALLQANNRRPDLYIRPVGTGAEDALAALAGAGVAAERSAARPESLRVQPPATATDALAAVDALVQDPAASLAVDYAAVPPDARVLDLCAAPGGKALALTTDSAFVVAADLVPRRLERIRENAARLRLQGRVAAVAADARHPPFRPAEAVLLDVPCTGTGTLRRHPDGRWRVTLASIAELAALQREMLHAAAGLVLPGGVLVYSTCSLEPEENELQVTEFLESHPQFELHPVANAVDARWVDADGRLSVLPQNSGVDGAFAARLRRRA